MHSRSIASRDALVRALADGDWPWAPALRADATFVDGICELAAACVRAGIGELALAAAVAGEGREQSALARLLLIWYRARPAEPEGRVPQARAAGGARRIACGSLADAFAIARERGISDFVLPRWIAATVGAEIASGVQTPDARAIIEFDETAGRAAGIATMERALGARPAPPDHEAELILTVDRSAPAALAQWLVEAPPREEPWAWPPAEPPRPLIAPPMAFSASRLNGFVKCPRRWFFEYLCDALADKGSPAATYGRVFHEALESLHRTIRTPADWSGNAILERLHADLDYAFDRNRAEFASPLDFEVSRLKARAVAAHYARWLRAEAEDHPMQVDAVEALQRWTMGGHEFVGFIDRIDRPACGGPVTVYDYKTGRVDDDVDDYVAKIRSGEEAQLALYYTVRRMRGDDVGRLALISLRDPRDPIWVLALDMVDASGAAVVERTPRTGVVRGTATPADMEAGVQALLARADELTKQGRAHFEVGVDPPCSFCTYARACRERPADGERVFAR